MKRCAYLILSLCLLAVLCACGNTDTEPTTATTTQAPLTTQPSTAATTTQAPTTESTTQEPTTAAFSLSDVSLTATPNSSCFSKIGYSEAHETLVLVFRSSGSTYLYAGVPVSVWQSFRGADSLGRYFNTKIKGSYPCEKV